MFNEKTQYKQIESVPTKTNESKAISFHPYLSGSLNSVTEPNKYPKKNELPIKPSLNADSLKSFKSVIQFLNVFGEL